MHVPFIDLKPTISRVREAVLKRWQLALDSSEFVGGSAVQELEENLGKSLGVTNFISCSSGTDALIIGLQALGIRPGMKVAVPDLTFWAPYEAIVQIGAIPVLIDIDEADLQMSFSEFCAAHQKFEFDGAIFVHLYGWTSRYLKNFREFCRHEGIVLLEDGAQAYGVKVNGESVFAGAVMSTLSFYPAKVFGGSGDGGGIATSDPKLAAHVRALCNHGRAGHYTYDYVGWNSRLGGLQACYLNEVYRHIDAMLSHRRKALSFYSKALQSYSDQIEFYLPPSGVLGNGYLAVLIVKDLSGDQVAAELKKRLVGCARTYPVPLGAQPPALEALRSSDLKASNRVCNQVINLPLFYGIQEEQCKAVVDALLDVLDSHNLGLGRRVGEPIIMESKGGLP